MTPIAVGYDSTFVPCWAMMRPPPGKPFTPVHRHADIATPDPTYLEAVIARDKIKLLLITRPVGNMVLAVAAHHLSLSVDHHHSVVIAVVSLFEETKWQYYAQFGG